MRVLQKKKKKRVRVRINAMIALKGEMNRFVQLLGYSINLEGK